MIFIFRGARHTLTRMGVKAEIQPETRGEQSASALRAGALGRWSSADRVRWMLEEVAWVVAGALERVYLPFGRRVCVLSGVCVCVCLISSWQGAEWVCYERAFSLGRGGGRRTKKAMPNGRQRGMVILYANPLAT